MLFSLFLVLLSPRQEGALEGEQVGLQGGKQAGVGGCEQGGEEALEEAEVPLAATGTS